jgi:hypothetical protein
MMNKHEKTIKFGKENNDLTACLFNFDNPQLSKTINGIEYKITDGLIENNKKTHLLYANKNVILKSYSVNYLKSFVDNANHTLIKILLKYKLL